MSDSDCVPNDTNDGSWFLRPGKQQLASKALIITEVSKPDHSPFDGLPAEIIGEIFRKYYLKCQPHSANPHYHRPRSWSTQHTITHVCRRWNDVGRGCPFLWSCIYLEWPVKTVQLYLSRSKSAPLDILWSEHNYHHANIAALVSHASRWRRLILRNCATHLHKYAGYWSFLHANLRFSLEMDYEHWTPGRNAGQDWSRHFWLSENGAAKLCMVDLSLFGRVSSHIKHFSYNVTKLALRLDFPFAKSDIANALQGSVVLQKLIIEYQLSFFFDLDDHEEFSLPSLHTLVLQALGSSNDYSPGNFLPMFFHVAKFPELKSLHIILAPGSVYHRLFKYIQTGQFKSFALSGISFLNFDPVDVGEVSDDSFAQILQLMPAITHLGLKGTHLLILLSHLAKNRFSFLPNLQTLSFHCKRHGDRDDPEVHCCEGFVELVSFARAKPLLQTVRLFPGCLVANPIEMEALKTCVDIQHRPPNEWMSITTALVL